MAAWPALNTISALALCLIWGLPCCAQVDSLAAQPKLASRLRPDTLELPMREGQLSPPPPVAAKSVLIPSDEDRQLGNLGDMLERLAGVHVVRTGQLGDYLGVSIRGSSENQVNVYVNGVLKNPGVDPSAFLGNWDLSRVERIEVYKGLAPEDLPGSPMGGAINIITRQGGVGPGIEAAVGAGSFGSRRANGTVKVNHPGWRLNLQAARDQSEGNFTYYDDNGTEFLPGRFPDGAPRRSADDLIRKTRYNNAHALNEIVGNLALTPSANTELGVAADFSRLHKEIPALYANSASSKAVSASRGSDRFTARSYGHWNTPRLELGANISATQQRDSYLDTASAGGSVGLGYNDESNEYDDALATATARATLSDHLTLTALGTYGMAGYTFTDRIAGKTYPALIRYTGEGKLTPTYVLGRHSLQGILSVTILLQDGKDQDLQRHQSLRLGYQYRPSAGLWFSAQGGNAYRIPTFMEKFGDRGAVMANSSLKSEAGFNASAAMHIQGRWASAEITGFLSDGSRIITLVQNSQSVLVYRNAGETRVLGWESRACAKPSSWTRTELDLTLQRALNLSTGSSVEEYKLIPYRPLTQASLRQTFLLGPWTTSAYVYYQGLTYPNPSNHPSLFDSYSHNTQWQSRCDLMVSWRMGRFLTAAALRNVFDARNFDFFNFPLAGRSFSASLQVEL